MSNRIDEDNNVPVAQTATMSNVVQFSSGPSSNSRSAAIHESAASQTATMTITQQRMNNHAAIANEEVLPLTLRGRATVTWDENVEDNEGLGRKSSKRCCIFHKQRDFGESSTDSSDNDSDDDSDSSDREGTKGSNKNKEKRRNKIARPKQSKVPSYQRYHA